jgi:uracil-DNA glycosylase
MRKRDGRPFTGVSIKFVKEWLAKERASFLKINDINDISLFGMSDCRPCCSIA